MFNSILKAIVKVVTPTPYVSRYEAEEAASIARRTAMHSFITNMMDESLVRFKEDLNK